MTLLQLIIGVAIAILLIELDRRLAAKLRKHWRSRDRFQRR